MTSLLKSFYPIYYTPHPYFQGHFLFWYKLPLVSQIAQLLSLPLLQQTQMLYRTGMKSLYPHAQFIWV
ncbi:hypothetical protein HK12_06520 [Acetobacter orientalis]|uniref:Uncharacterized protein n=1 Tax=Acetobacter orientalis TaxID=146474 RepID=A0A252A6W8_9PROT|nr:hypothetical protein HK12_06520 [Acetobacter orientalis]